MADVATEPRETEHATRHRSVGLAGVGDAMPPVPLAHHKFGMWLFLASEVMFFTGLLGTYLVLRLSDPEGFSEQAHHLDWRPAAVNTMVLIFSSLTMALSIHYAQIRDAGKTKLMLAITFACGLAFMAIKAYEYNGKFSHGIYPETHIFFASYFTLTGIHGLHVVGGMVPIFIMLIKVSSSPDVTRQAGTLECLGLYWHFVDLVWIFLFPLFYLLH